MRVESLMNRNVLRDVPVATAMSRRLLSCEPGSSLEQVEQLMQTSQIRRVPVVDPGGKLLGIIALSDLAKRGAPTAQDVAQTLAAVSEQRQARAQGPEASPLA